MKPIRPILTFVAGALTVTVVGIADLWPELEAAPVPAPAPAPAPADEDDATFTPVEPCRVVDTRPGSTVGPRSTPLGAGEVAAFAVTGDNGDCTGIDVNATAVALNVTIAGPSAASNLRLYPADLTEPPTVSNLNWVAGQPPTPNKVDVKLSPGGEVNVRNAFGTVHVIMDVVGTYGPSTLDSLRDRVAALEASQPTVVSASADLTFLATSRSSVLSVDVTVDRPSTVVVTGSTSASTSTAGSAVACHVTTTPTSPGSFDSSIDKLWEPAGATIGSSAGEGDNAEITDVAVFDQAAGTTTYHLACLMGNLSVLGSARATELIAVVVPE